MSGFISALGSLVDTVVLSRPRMLGPVIPDCAVAERHMDRLETTQHPVELGAMISDHAYMLPFEVTLRYAWSNSPTVSLARFASTLANLPSQFTESYIDKIYSDLRQLQQKPELITIITGKRIYNSMLIVELEVETDAASEYSLMVQATCRQIIITKTSAASIPVDPLDQKEPQNTSTAVDRGPQQALPVPPIPPANPPVDIAET